MLNFRKLLKNYKAFLLKKYFDSMSLVRVGEDTNPGAQSWRVFPPVTCIFLNLTILNYDLQISH